MSRLSSLRGNFPKAVVGTDGPCREAADARAHIPTSTSPGDRTVISMSLTSEGGQMPDAERNHDRISASSQKSKAEQLARTRRNQQRCRERKRTHAAELERQVEALQAKIRQCEPCASPSPPEHESALDTALRENAARRDLLSALGFDDETQQRFIESAVKRQTVYTVLQGERDRTSPSQSPGERLADTPLAYRARFDAQSASGCAESADLGSGSGQTMDSLQTTTELADVALNRQADALDPAIENWFLPPETFDKSQRQLIDPSSDSSWLTESYSSYANLVQGTVNAFETTDSALALGAIPMSSLDSSRNDLHWASITSTNNLSEADQSAERCFLDTVVQFQPGETSTVCSIALALIFRHNRKGLSMGELQKHLKPGIHAPSGTSGECCIENSVLFKVLADIST